jgi:hypothetical protein
MSNLIFVLVLMVQQVGQTPILKPVQLFEKMEACIEASEADPKPTACLIMNKDKLVLGDPA